MVGMAADERGRGAGTLEGETKMKKARGGKIADVDKSAISISTGILGHVDHSDRFEVGKARQQEGRETRQTLVFFC